MQVVEIISDGIQGLYPSYTVNIVSVDDLTSQEIRAPAAAVFLSIWNIL